jgi:hypothetical protein
MAMHKALSTVHSRQKCNPLLKTWSLNAKRMATKMTIYKVIMAKWEATVPIMIMIQMKNDNGDADADSMGESAVECCFGLEPFGSISSRQDHGAASVGYRSITSVPIPS